MKIIIILANLVFLSSCATMVGTVMTIGADRQLVGESYPSFPARSTEVDRYRSELAAYDKRVTTDEKGSYYIELKGEEGVYMTGFKTGDSNVLKKLLTQSVGLMEPLYKIDSSGNLVLNEFGSEKRHSFLVNTVGLRLLPLDETYKYHNMVKQYARSEADRIVNGSGFAGLKGVMSGNTGFYSDSLYKKLISGINGKFDYLVQNPAINTYSNQVQEDIIQAVSHARMVESRENSDDPRAKYRADSEPSSLDDNLKLRSAASMVDNMFDIYFVPLEYYKTARKNLNFNAPSGCRYMNFEQTKQRMAYLESLTDIPYFSVLSSMYKAKGKDEMDKSRIMFEEAISRQGQVRVNSQDACLIGLKALDVNGAIESRRLN